MVTVHLRKSVDDFHGTALGNSSYGVLNLSDSNDVIMGVMTSQINSLTIVYSTVHSGDQRNHQSPASLAFVRVIHRRPVNSPHKGPVTQKMFPFDDVIMRKLTFDLTLHRTSLFLFKSNILLQLKTALHPQLTHLTNPIMYWKMSHNAPFCDRNVHICAHLCKKLCIVGSGFILVFVQHVYMHRLHRPTSSRLVPIPCTLFSWP